jgi:hypothetical protein
MEKDQRPHEENPSKDFETIWESGDESRGSYSLVFVPNAVPSRLVYKKPALDIDIKLIPTKSVFYWQVNGTLDPDTIENLGMNVSQPRQGAKPPVVTESDLEQLGKYGKVAHAPDNPMSFDVEFTVPINNIYRFLYKVWRPIAHTKKFPESVPDYFLGGTDKNYRVLPQKIIYSNNIERNATLIVEKIR